MWLRYVVEDEQPSGFGPDRSDIALIASVSAAAGLVAAQFGPASRGHNVVIGEREYSSNHYPWRLLASKGYEIRQVPFRNGGLEPDDIAARVDGRTVVVAFSGVQAATGHRSDIQAISAIAAKGGCGRLRARLTGRGCASDSRGSRRHRCLGDR